MELHEIYKSDIDRDISGVIKASQNDEMSIAQELREYVVTKELNRHFTEFLDVYERSLTILTDKIGVWISGFFGSGKSHLLKILSYLLSNKIVLNIPSVEFFADKFDDPAMYERLCRCAFVPTETILFNIDSKAPVNKDKTAILRVFAKVFYDHLGYCGDDLRIAALEQFIDTSGKTDDFRAKFTELHGDTWENSRNTAIYCADAVIRALIEVMGMSENSARELLSGESTSELSIERLVTEIKAYLDRKGVKNRLIFMVDEIGQYIGLDSDLLLNLQTIVEEIGSRCEGRVWVIVTSQESIGSLTSRSDSDFSKIQGRFDTRLSLSSSSVDEVIKRRILAKNNKGIAALQKIYHENQAVMRSNFTLGGTFSVHCGFADETDFIETYPFVPYQLRLMQEVLVQLRERGSTGCHLSGGERSMLACFHDAAKSIRDSEVTEIAQFSLFFDTLYTFLDISIRQVIADAEVHGALEPGDIDVLKLLCLIRHVPGIKADLESMTVLMTDSVNPDRLAIRQRLHASLDRLAAVNFVSRIGDIYTFMTADEQRISREIAEIEIDSSAISAAVSDVIFGEIFTSKFVRIGKSEFGFNVAVDDFSVGRKRFPIGLRIVTSVSDEHDAEARSHIMRSKEHNEAIVVLFGDIPYIEELETAMRIRKYLISQNTSALPETIRGILDVKAIEASEHENRAAELIAEAVKMGEFYAVGEHLELRSGSAKERLNRLLSFLVENVYTKHSLIAEHCVSVKDVAKIFVGADAENELMTYLGMQSERRVSTTMRDIQARFMGVPYGWNDLDIAALVLGITIRGGVRLSIGGLMVEPDDSRIPELLIKPNFAKTVIVERCTAIPDALLRGAREFLREFFNTMDVPSAPNELSAYITDGFSALRNEYASLLEREYSHREYPDKQAISDGIALICELLSHSGDTLDLLKKMRDLEDDLLDNSDDISAVKAFFANQRVIFDIAHDLVSQLEPDLYYLRDDTSANHAISEISAIISLPKPYRRISELPALTRTVRSSHKVLLDARKNLLFSSANSVCDELHLIFGDIPQNTVDDLDCIRSSAEHSELISLIDALRARLSDIRREALLKLASEKGYAVVAQNDHTVLITSRDELDDFVEELKNRLDESDGVILL